MSCLGRFDKSPPRRMWTVQEEPGFTHAIRKDVFEIGFFPLFERHQIICSKKERVHDWKDDVFRQTSHKDRVSGSQERNGYSESIM
jgi:hypothetical protein